MRAVFTLIVTLLFSALSFTALAQVQKEGLSMSLGSLFTQVDSSIGSELKGSSTTYNGSLDFESDLLVEDSSNSPYFELYWAYNERHHWSLNYLSLTRDGSKLATANMDIGDLEFQAGALIKSRFDTRLLQLKYAYSFYQNNDLALGTTLGLHLVHFDMHFKGLAAVKDSNGEPIIDLVERAVGLRNIVPLPNFGLYSNYLLSDDFYLNAVLQYFAINFDISDSLVLDAGMLAANLGVEYYLVEDFSLYMGMSYQDIYAELDHKGNYLTTKWDVQFTYWGPLLLIKYSF